MLWIARLVPLSGLAADRSGQLLQVHNQPIQLHSGLCVGHQYLTDLAGHSLPKKRRDSYSNHRSDVPNHDGVLSVRDAVIQGLQIEREREANGHQNLSILPYFIRADNNELGGNLQA